MSEPTQARRPSLSLLSHAGAAFATSKSVRIWYWALEAGASLIGLAAAFIPVPFLAAVLGGVAVAAKGGSKVAASRSRALYRDAERARRLHFENEALGWPVPLPFDADLRISLAGTIAKQAADRAGKDESYYQMQGAPSTGRFFHNLAESIFWTEKLMRWMEGQRRKHFAFASLLAVAALVGLLLVEPSGIVNGAQVSATIFVGLRVIGAIVALLVAVDLYGERAAYARGERGCRDLLAELTKAMAANSHERGLQLFTEYNCLLADLPAISDAAYKRNHEILDNLWADAAKKLPGGSLAT